MRFRLYKVSFANAALLLVMAAHASFLITAAKYGMSANAREEEPRLRPAVERRVDEKTAQQQRKDDSTRLSSKPESRFSAFPRDPRTLKDRGLEECDIPEEYADWIGDGWCDYADGNFNTAACNYDGGDCCMSTCVPTSKYFCDNTPEWRHCEDNNVHSLSFLSYTPECEGYFCDKYIDTVFILMTHNSYAVNGQVIAPNQRPPMTTQFSDGIRAFSLDIIEELDENNNTVVMLKHGDDPIKINYTERILEIVEEMMKPEFEYEFLLVQFEDYLTSYEGMELTVAPWGDLVITDFDNEQPLGYYISQGKRVLLVTEHTKHTNTTLGMHSTHRLISENQYNWGWYLESPPMEQRRGPDETWDNYRYFRLMNYFCETVGVGNEVDSASVNRKGRIMSHVREFVNQTYTQGVINILAVDFYSRPKARLSNYLSGPFEAQAAIRRGNYTEGCLPDGSRCGGGTGTCFNCCGGYSEFWDSKAFTACGREPCLPQGTTCIWTTSCNNCCNKDDGRANCPWYSLGICKCN